MTPDRKDLDAQWLQAKVMALLEHASRGDPDYQACAKYAEILFKMLPRGKAQRTAGEVSLEEVRQAVLEGQAPREP